MDGGPAINLPANLERYGYLVVSRWARSSCEGMLRGEPVAAGRLPRSTARMLEGCVADGTPLSPLVWLSDVGRAKLKEKRPGLLS